MAKNYKGIQNYTDTLLAEWVRFNEGLLQGNFSNNAGTLTRAIGDDTSSSRSRAVEFYKIGLLNQSLSNRSVGLDSIKQGNNLQSRLGFLSAVIYKAYQEQKTKSISNAFYALNALYAILLSIDVDGKLFSINYIISKLRKAYPCENDIDKPEWSKYLLASFICEAYDGSRNQELIDFLLDRKEDLKLRFIYNRDGKIKGEFNNTDELKAYIRNDRSLNDIYAQRVNKYMYEYEGGSPKGCFAIAEKYYKSFLDCCYDLESQTGVLSSPFISLYGDDSINKSRVLETLKEICRINTNLETKFKEIMKSIEEGALEAISYLSGKSLKQLLIPNTTCMPIIYYGAPGTGKTRFVQEEIYNKFPEECRSFVTFHQSFSYEEFVEGIKPQLNSNDISYTIEKGIFYEACEKASKLAGYKNLSECISDQRETRIEKFKKAIEEHNTFVLCIDEINRGNIASIFGDLISLIESSKRLGGEYEMTSTLPYSKSKFGVPANLLIIGTMNTADRSIQLLDTALRRRFKFVEIGPNYSNEIFDKNDSIKTEARDILIGINSRIRCLLNKDNQIGHSYLMKVNDYDDIYNVFITKIIPLLEEYFYNDIDKVRFILNDKVDKNNSFYVEDEEASKAYKDYINESYDEEEKKFYKLREKEPENMKEFFAHLLQTK